MVDGPFEKIGYYDLDLASVAGGAEEFERVYSMVINKPTVVQLMRIWKYEMKLNVLEGDQIFRRYHHLNLFNHRLKFIFFFKDLIVIIRISKLNKSHRNKGHEAFPGLLIFE